MPAITTAVLGALAAASPATIIGGVGAAAGVAGGIMSYEGQQAANDAEKQQEADRNTQMNLDASRQRRDIARKAIMSRSDALAAATSGGAQQGSGLQGGYAGIFSQAGMATTAVNQNQQVGQDIFNQAAIKSDAQTTALTGQAISQVGGQFYQNRDMLGRVGSYITGTTTW